MKRFPALAGVALLLGTFALAACEPTDKDLVMYFAKEWGKQHGLYNEDGSPTKLALARGIAPSWLKPDIKDANGEVDEAGNAAVDAGAIVKSMVDNDKIAVEAMSDLAKKDDASALKKINFTIAARPNDWYYLNRRAVIYAAQGEDKKAAADFAAAEELCGGSQRCMDAQSKDRARLMGGF